MSFLFKSKKQQGAALQAPTRNIGSPHAQDASLSATNSTLRRDGDVQQGVQPTQTASSSVNASVASLSGTTATEGTSTPTDARQLRQRSGSDLHVSKIHHQSTDAPKVWLPDAADPSRQAHLLILRVRHRETLRRHHRDLFTMRPYIPGPSFDFNIPVLRQCSSQGMARR